MLKQENKTKQEKITIKHSENSQYTRDTKVQNIK